MTNEEARKRARAAIDRAYDESNAFESGGLASHEIMDWLYAAIDKEFRRGHRDPTRSTG